MDVDRRGFLTVGFQRVDHDVAHKPDLVPVQTFVLQIFHRHPVGGQQEVRQVVGYHAVDLLGNGQVARTQSRLNVTAFDIFFLGRNGAGQRGIYIAHHHHPVGPDVMQYFFKGHHGPAHLLGMGAGTDLEVKIGHGNVQVLKKCL